MLCSAYDSGPGLSKNRSVGCDGIQRHFGICLQNGFLGCAVFAASLAMGAFEADDFSKMLPHTAESLCKKMKNESRLHVSKDPKRCGLLVTETLCVTFFEIPVFCCVNTQNPLGGSVGGHNPRTLGVKFCINFRAETGPPPPKFESWNQKVSDFCPQQH